MSKIGVNETGLRLKGGRGHAQLSHLLVCVENSLTEKWDGKCEDGDGVEKKRTMLKECLIEVKPP